MKEKLESENKKVIENLKADSDKKIDDLKKKFALAEDAAAQALKRAEDFEKQLAVSSSPEATKFTFFFEALQNDYNKMLGSIAVLKKENISIAEKYVGAIKKYHNILAGEFKKLGFELEDMK